MGSKEEKSIHSLDQLQVPTTLDKFIEELPERYVEGQINKEIEEQIDIEWNAFQNDLKKKEPTFRKKVVIFSLSLAAAFGLFIGSAFVSPAMAEIASKIPYLNLLFESEQKPVIDEIKEALDGKGYKWDGLGVSVQPREVSVMIVGTDKYYNQVKSEVEDLIKDILKSRNYNAYDVKVTKAPVMEEPTAEEKKESEQYHKIYKIVEEVLQKYGYNSLGQRNGISDELIEFELPKTESRIEEIKKQVRDRLKQKGFDEFSIKVYTFNPQKREREGRWMPIVSTISDGLTAKAEYKVKLVGYTNKFDYLPISIETTLSASDTDSEKIVEAIEETVQDYLHSEKVRNIIKNDQYEINIYSNKGKKLN
ncbi:hypothetical protein OKW24_001278 [Peribacillus simplex]|uniref:DUF4030 domain-containing protein n=1 Tax=Peribacillus simplex TaxID=1478 RepID=UPI0024E21D8D|nr:DUF4030 domain-containing protein [Peribacillus simplex]MDF9759505.1 hypothetical protein [Peribacillus simplex]